MSAEGLRSQQARAQTLILAAIVASTMSWMIAATGFFSFVAVGAPVGIIGDAHVTAMAETLMYRDSRALPVAGGVW